MSALAVVAGTLGLGGCGAVDVAAPPEAANAACTAAAGAWPETVADESRTATTSDSPAVAAWGDPAIVARCGLTPPGPTTDECVDIDGIDWVVRPLDDGQAYTTYGRSPAIEVLVPRDHDPSPLLLTAFTQAARQTPATERSCV